MRLSRLGYVFYVTGLILLSILAIEELLNNFNYYYYNQANFLLLFLAGLLSFLTGIVLGSNREIKRADLSQTQT